MLNTSRLRIIAIGKVRKKWIQSGIDLYLNRLPGLTINEIRDSNLPKEAKSIKTALGKDETLVSLSESGEALTSIQLAHRLKKSGHRSLAFVIGGPNGLSPEIDDIAAWNFSLSALTFPHEIARLLLIEQIYRAQSITQGSPYHRQ